MFDWGEKPTFFFEHQEGEVLQSLIVVLWVTLVAFVGLSGRPVEGQSAAAHNADYSEEECYVKGLVSKLRCYSLVRPIAGEAGETVTLRGVIVPSDAVVPEPDPLVVLVGGPGQAASDSVSMLTKVFRIINNSRDLIFFDIRGTGFSLPVDCYEDVDLPPLVHVPTEEIVGQIEACYQKFGSKLAGATTRQAVADLDALRQALGIDQLNLWGASYGTRFAQYYMVEHGAHVRSAILDAVVPFTPSYVTQQSRNSHTALMQLQAACLADKGCNTAYPGFDPIALLDQIETGKKVSYLHPVTGKLVETTTSRTAVAQIIFSALYHPKSRIFVPYTLTEAVVNDNWGPLAVLGVDIGRYMGNTTIYVGAFLSVTCAEEKAALAQETENIYPFMGRDALDIQGALCDVWPVVEQPLPQPSESSVATPVFMISGGMDPITPASLADMAVPVFQNARHFVVESGAHINSMRPCITDFLPDFIKTPLDKSLMPECISDTYVPGFVVGTTGPFGGGDVE